MNREAVIELMDARACEYGVAHSAEDCWRHREIVTVALDAALSSGLCVLVDDLEQVGWIDYERDDEERAAKPWCGRFALTETSHDGAQYGNTPIYRLLIAEEEKPAK